VKKIIILTLMILLILPFVLAENYLGNSAFYVKQSEDTNIKISCISSSNEYCASSTSCNLTVLSPNGITLINNREMTHNPSYYNYSIPASNLSNSGLYSSSMECRGTTSGFETFKFEVTPTGKEPREKNQNNILGILGIITFFIVMGIINKVALNNKKEMQESFKLPLALEISSFGFALIEIVLLAGIMFAYELGFDFTKLLQINFYSILIVAFGVGMMTLINKMMDSFNWSEAMSEDEKWSKNNKKW